MVQATVLGPHGLCQALAQDELLACVVDKLELGRRDEQTEDDLRRSLELLR